MTHRRVDWGDRGRPEFVDVPYWRVAGSWCTGGFVVGFVFCLILLTTCDARAGGGELQEEIPDCSQYFGADYEECVAYAAELLMSQQQQLQQQQMLPPEQYARPNQPTMLVVDGGSGSSVGEWAALLTGIAALVGALEAFRRRRRRAPD